MSSCRHRVYMPKFLVKFLVCLRTVRQLLRPLSFTSLFLIRFSCLNLCSYAKRANFAWKKTEVCRLWPEICSFHKSWTPQEQFWVNIIAVSLKWCSWWPFSLVLDPCLITHKLALAHVLFMCNVPWYPEEHTSPHESMAWPETQCDWLWILVNNWNVTKYPNQSQQCNTVILGWTSCLVLVFIASQGSCSFL